MVSDFRSGMPCSSNAVLQFRRFSSSICSASAFRLVVDLVKMAAGYLDSRRRRYSSRDRSAVFRLLLITATGTSS